MKGKHATDINFQIAAIFIQFWGTVGTAQNNVVTLRVCQINKHTVVNKLLTELNIPVTPISGQSILNSVRQGARRHRQIRMS